MSVDVDVEAGEHDAAEYPFARFWKCALQVNPEGYSRTYRGQDHGLEGEAFLAALLKECQDNAIDLIGIADHGRVQDVDAIRAYLEPHGIVVLPGFEICTTEKVDWVCLFPANTSTETLNRYLGVLKLTDPQEGVRPSRLGGEELLKEISELQGFCYAAHATGRSGVLRQKAHHLWRNPLLEAAQIPGSVGDLQVEFRRIVENKDPNYGRDRPIGVINAKDVASPEDLRDPRSSCFIKMTRPTFEALCVAFKDPASRVRLHDEIGEQHYSRIVALRIEGGHLDGLDVRFSDHLNTIIGGRGTGKSTLLECLRYALDVDHKTAEARKQGDSIVRENLGKQQGRIEVDVLSHAQNLHRYRVVRRYGEPPRIIDEQGNASTLEPADLLPGIEIYGQNEIYDLARDDAALVRVLDRYLPNRGADQKRIAALRRKLKSNSESLLSALEQREELAAQLQKLPRLQEQVRQFDELGLRDKLKQVPLLEKERQLAPRLAEDVDRLTRAVDALQDSLPDTTFVGDKAIEDLPHAELLRRGRTVLDGLRESASEQIAAMTKAAETAGGQIAQIVQDLESARRTAEDALEKEFAKLPAVAGKDGAAVGRTYQTLQRQIETIRPYEARVATTDRLVSELEQERRNLLGELSDVRNSRTRILEREIKRLNRKLAGKLRITLQPGRNRKALKDFLGRLTGIGEKATAWVDDAGDDLTIPALVEACGGGLQALVAKQWGITKGRAEAICRMTRSELLELEVVDLEDRVDLELNVAHEGQVYRPLKHLSTGQQCTAILHLLLLDNPDPLVMDQPEDNLDNAFIADRIVHQLREAKTTRQFIFATHNANVPVFGDAEWIGVFTASESHGEIPPENQGSIDVPHIRDEAARILDGGREAFLQRREKYGF